MKAVNLIPNEQRGAAAPAVGGTAAPSSDGDGFGAYAILGILLFAVIAAALYVMAGNSVTKNKAELATVTAEVEQVKAEAASMQSFVDFKTLADSRVATVRGLADARFDWARSLDDVSRALPADVFVSSLNGTTNSASGSGSSIRGAIAAPAIELLGCTRSQSSVARLMSRLRNVRGVTRVSLAKSTKDDTTATAAPASVAPTGALGDTTGEKAPEAPKTVSTACPDGTPPAFEMVAFFERSVVGANAGPNMAATGVAGPTGTSGTTTGPTGSTGATTPATSTTTTTP